MQVILTNDMKGKGKKGELINVNDGYARNYLLPRGLAKEATNSNINVMNAKKAAQNYKKQKNLEKAKELALKLSKVTVTIQAKAGASGKLFGSITTKDITEALKNQHNIEVEKRKINLSEPIKTLGTFEIDIKIYPEVNSKIKVKITDN